MSRRTLGPSPVLAGSADPEAFTWALASAPARREVALVEWVPPAPPAPVDTPWPVPVDDRTPVERLRAAHLAAPTRPARDRLLLHYSPLVRTVAHRTAAGLPTYVDLGDLASAGVFGLIDAVERFDPERCPRSESYAAPRIRGAILDELRAQDWVPRTIRNRACELERARESLEARLWRAATDRELADERGVAPRDLRALTRHTRLVSAEIGRTLGRHRVRGVPAAHEARGPTAGPVGGAGRRIGRLTPATGPVPAATAPATGGAGPAGRGTS